MSRTCYHPSHHRERTQTACPRETLETHLEDVNLPHEAMTGHSLSPSPTPVLTALFWPLPAPRGRGLTWGIVSGVPC